MLNKVQLIGNLGDDPEVKHGRSSGEAFVVLSLATTEKWKGKDGLKEERTEWHRVTVFAAGLVDVCRKYLRKGSRVYIEGRIQYETYDKDGETRYATKIVVPAIGGKLVMLDGAKKEPA